MTAQEFVPLAARRTHGTKQDWPFKDELPQLVDSIDVHGLTGPTGQTAWSRLKIILQGERLIPPTPERPSERAMRLSAALRPNQRAALRREIDCQSFLEIDDETSTPAGFAVIDRRQGRNLGTWIASIPSLHFLVREGAEAWLESGWNTARVAR